MSDIVMEIKTNYINSLVDDIMHGTMPNTIPSVPQHKAIDELAALIPLSILQEVTMPKFLVGKLGLIVTSAEHQLSQIGYPVFTGIHKLFGLSTACETYAFWHKDLNNRSEFCRSVVTKLKPLIKLLQEYLDKV